MKKLSIPWELKNRRATPFRLHVIIPDLDYVNPDELKTIIESLESGAKRLREFIKARKLKSRVQ